MRFTAAQYDQAAEWLRDGRDQLRPDGGVCRICHDSGHQAWECGHNPLRAMVVCAGVAAQASALHDRLHAIEEAMNDADQSEALATWREEAHDFLHGLAGFVSHMGHQLGPASVMSPDPAEAAS